MATAASSIAVATTAQSARGWPAYNTVWRWHFYAGLLCLPFILWLPITGGIYLFKPQIESWLDKPYEQLTLTGVRATPSARVDAAPTAVGLILTVVSSTNMWWWRRASGSGCGRRTAGAVLAAWPRCLDVPYRAVRL
jgi:uncharacterized iron-regulated membrane protein